MTTATRTLRALASLSVLAGLLLGAGCHPTIPSDLPPLGDDDDDDGPVEIYAEDKEGRTPALAFARMEAELYVPLSQLDPMFLRGVSDPDLLWTLFELAQEARWLDRPVEVQVGLVAGWMEESPLCFQAQVFDRIGAEIFETDRVEPRDGGTYSAVDLMLVSPDPVCGLQHLDTLDPGVLVDALFPPMLPDDEAGATKEGGCCAILAVAHSLVRNMGGIVTEDDATTTNADGTQEWDPDFLRRVWEASGDTDNNRGLSDAEGHAAHEADWNDAWRVDNVVDDEEIYDGDDVDCDDLEEIADALIRERRTNNDMTMRIQGHDGDPDEGWGHRVPIESVSFTEGPPCSIEITITRTSRQDGAANDFRGIPFQPGTATYTVTTNGSGDTTVTNTEFPGSTITSLSWDSFDESATSSSVTPTTQGNPGSALTD